MKFRRHIVIRKITALLLIALMLFINAVKLFHTHSPISQSSGFNKIGFSHNAGDISEHKITRNDHCAICDFKLAKDAEASETFIAPIPLFHEALATVAKLATCIPAPLSISSGRAPPALV